MHNKLGLVTSLRKVVTIYQSNHNAFSTKANTQITRGIKVQMICHILATKIMGVHHFIERFKHKYNNKVNTILIDLG